MNQIKNLELSTHTFRETNLFFIYQVQKKQVNMTLTLGNWIQKCTKCRNQRR